MVTNSTLWQRLSSLALEELLLMMSTSVSRSREGRVPVKGRVCFMPAPPSLSSFHAPL